MKPLFQRGNGPLVSILLATRGRPDDLTRALFSLYNKAKDKSLLEFLLKVDLDDQRTINELNRVKPQLTGSKVEVVVSPKGRGYVDNHLWLNDLAARATGDWLFVFNDDARMNTDNWDQAILWAGLPAPWLGINEVCHLNTMMEGREPSVEFFFLRRKTYQLLGHFGLYNLSDDWVSSVMYSIQPRITASVEVAHKVPVDSVKRNNDLQLSVMRDFTKVRRGKWEAVNKLNNRLDELEKSSWREGSPVHGTWSLWDGGNGTQLFAVDSCGRTSVMDSGKPEQCIAPVGGKWAVISSW